MTDILVPTNKQNIILDATLLTSIMNCGRFTDLRFNQQLVQIHGKSNSLEVGSIVHKVLEVYYKSIISGVKRQDSIGFGLSAGELYIQGCKHCTDFEPIDCGQCSGSGTESPYETCNHCNGTGKLDKPVCGHPPNEYPGVKNTPPESTAKPDRVGWKWALETCEQYFDYYKNDFWIPLEVEIVKRKILYEDDNIRIMWKAKFDLVSDTNQGIYPIDHKSMKQRRDSSSLNNQFTGQCILQETRSVIINKIGFQTSLKPDEKFTRPMVNYSADRLIEWQSEILPYWAYKLIEHTESGYWPPDFSNCDGKFGPCVFKEVCEADRGMREQVLRNQFVVGPKWDIDNVED